MFEAQNGLCAICGEPEIGSQNGVVMRLAIDHCKKTNKIRELLCANCNRGLGMFGENIEILASAIKYLTKHS